MANKNTSMREALRAALHEEMVRDDRVFIMGEEVGRWDGTHKVTRGFLEEFGERRVRDTPISEMVIAGAAVGAAMAGLRPHSWIMTNYFAILAFGANLKPAAKGRLLYDSQVTASLVIRGAAWCGGQA